MVRLDPLAPYSDIPLDNIFVYLFMLIFFYSFAQNLILQKNQRDIYDSRLHTSSEHNVFRIYLHAIGMSKAKQEKQFS